MQIIKIILIALFFLSKCREAKSQDYPFKEIPYSFINENINIFNLNENKNWESLFEKFIEIGFRGEGQINIVHIGDSHMQADFFPGTVRRKMQTFFLGAMGGRGFIFPYKVANTNNPLNYKVNYTGNWTSCKNIDAVLKYPLGLSGIALITNDTSNKINISIEDPSLNGYDFNQVMVFHSFSDSSLIPVLKSDVPLINTEQFPQFGYTLFTFEGYANNITFYTQKKDSIQNQFLLYGFNFISDSPGIIYHTIGVNGARFDSYLRCQYFSMHLSDLSPDLIVLSLGTNDLYSNSPKVDEMIDNIRKLILEIKQTLPNAVILVTTPGDHFLKGQENKNLQAAAEKIKSQCKSMNCSTWDFYSVMGGEESIGLWHYAKLAHTDFVHLTPKGYELQGELFFRAFLKAFDEYLISNINR